MELTGKYYSSEINSTLVIDKANVSNGQASGNIELDGINVPVNIHFHFENNVGPVTDLSFSGNVDNPNEYVGGAGRTNNQNYSSIKIAGGYPTGKDVNTFEGEYKRQ